MGAGGDGPIVVREDAEPWREFDDPEVRRKSPVRWRLLVAGERTNSRDLTLGVAEVPPGAALLRHHHPPAEVYYILDGQGRTEIEGRAADIGPGSVVFIPGGAPHRTVNTGPTPLRFLWIFPTSRFDEVDYTYDE